MGSKIVESPLYIDDTASISEYKLRAKARNIKRNNNIGIIFVDYLQLMNCSKKTENKNQEVTEISKCLKDTARELNIPVVVCSQLSRDPEKRADPHPRLSDLRESGAIEQDADLVLFLYREEMYKPDDPNRGLAELIIAKQRNGPTGTMKLAFLKEYTRFEPLAKPDE